ncbi:MAG: hypothetical protein ABI639_09000 [Thermoanaerobaculia bacterium]
MHSPLQSAFRKHLAALSFLPILAASAALASNGANDLGFVAIFNDNFDSGSGCRWRVGGDFLQVCPYDFSCTSATAPTSAADPISLAGALTDFTSAAPISGATLEARRLSNDTLLDSETTLPDGSFSLTASTGSTPLGAYLTVTASTYANTRFYPADPMVDSETNIAVQAVKSSTLSGLYFLALGGPQTPGTGTTVVLVADCAGTPVAGATVAFTPPAGTLRYLAGGLPSSTATATDASGAALGLNAGAAGTSVAASYSGVAFKSHGFAVVGSTVSATLIHP